ncbi:MAG: hypothetical protein NTU83_07980, partial [Candidatus Hydrogenedentes bacterium]|nr:hypothetical protein [Candidatus Hydrogenedentota bacterium]
PWAVAHCRLKGEICRIYRTRTVKDVRRAQVSDFKPGSVTAVARDHVVVACGDGALAILEIQMPGKKPMPVDAFMRGRLIAVGDAFEDLPS